MASGFSVMDFEIITERLYLSIWEESDASWYRELVGERGVDKPTLEDARKHVISLHDRALESGIGALTIRRKDEGDMIGYCGLIIGRSTLEEPEIAYELFKCVHGKGYATEAALTIVGAAGATGRKRLWATVGSWNIASFRVLEKIGFIRHHSTWKEDGEEVVWNMRDL